VFGEPPAGVYGPPVHWVQTAAEASTSATTTGEFPLAAEYGMAGTVMA
jgi:hypothetical protein